MRLETRSRSWTAPSPTFTGTVREVDQGELVVEVAMFGRPVPIRTEPWQVTPHRA